MPKFCAARTRAICMMLNGEAVQGDPIELINGDRISFGQVSFIYITDKGEEA